jgi:hypothetical protein
LPLAAALVAASLFALFDLSTIAEVVTRHPAIADFGLYYTAARVGAAHGWAAVYDPGAFFPALHALGRRDWSPYLNPPILAWLVLPLSWLPYGPAFALWLSLTSGALVLTWWLAAPGGRAARVTHLAAAVALFPMTMALYHGQALLVVLAAVAVAAWLLRRGHDVWAGLALGALWLKPQTALLVPLALLVAGRWKATAAFAAVTLALAVAVVLALGPEGTLRYIDALRTLQIPSATSYLTALLGPVLARPVEVAFACLALVAAWRGRARRIDFPIAAALVGSLLASPYGNEYDLAALVLAAWLLLRAGATVQQALLMMAGYLAAEFVNVIGPGPALVFETVLMISLLSPREDAVPPRASTVSVRS